jgi:hypothetical protein
MDWIVSKQSLVSASLSFDESLTKIKRESWSGKVTYISNLLKRARVFEYQISIPIS